MTITVGDKLSKESVYHLLSYFDDSSEIPLHEGLDFDFYSEKLSKNALFILAHSDYQCVGFLAYYLNEESGFIYIPQVIVHKEERGHGIGHQMFNALYCHYTGIYEKVRLEVLKTNDSARRFYAREGFSFMEDHGERLLLIKLI